MSSYNNNCIPLILTPIGPTGASGAAGGTGANGSDGFSVVSVLTADVNTASTQTWETLNSYISTSQLNQNGDGFKVEVLFRMSTGSNSKKCRFTINTTSGITYTASAGETLRMDLSIIRISSTKVKWMVQSATSFASFPKLSYDEITVANLDSNALTIDLDGNNDVADPTQFVTLHYAVFNLMNKV